MNESISSLTSDRYSNFETFSKYYMALLIILGTFGNIFCIVAYMTSDVKKYGSTRYLIALSISDLGFVICMSLTWIKTFDLNWQDLPGLCEISTYVSSVCCFLSGWYVMALSGERCLAVCWPYLARRVCTPRRTTALIMLLAVVGAMVNAPLFYVAKSISSSEGDRSIVAADPADRSIPELGSDSVTDQSILSDGLANHLIVESISIVTGLADHVTAATDDIDTNASIDHQSITDQSILSDPITYHCGVDPNTETVYRAFTTVDTVVSFSMPLIVTLLLNVGIAYSLCRAAGERRALTSHSETSTSRFTSSFNHRSSSRQPQTKDRSLHEYTTRRNAVTSAATTGSTTKTRLLKQNGPTPRKVLERKITSVLVAKCVAYLILNLPSYLHRIVLAFEAPVGEQDAQTGGGEASVASEESAAASMVSNRFVEMVVYLLFYTQFSTNFLLYSFNACVTGAVKLRTDSIRRSIRSGHLI